VGSLKFYEREEIKDALALLSFLVNPRDEVAFRRVVNKPARGVGPVTVDKIIESASTSNLAEAARSIAPKLSAKAQSGIMFFLKMIDGARGTLEASVPEAAVGVEVAGENANAEAAGDTAAGGAKKKRRRSSKNNEGLISGEGLSVCVVQLVRDSGIAEYHQTQDEVSGNQRLNNLQELANAASLYAPTREGLLEFLEHIELDRSLEDQANEKGEANNTVTLITFHNTKGLEFRRVIMTGLEQGVFPREDKKDEELEEERRLFYVGATRAMDELYLSSCAMRRMYGRTMPSEPSLFLREIDRGALRIIGKAPYGFAGAGAGGGAGQARRPNPWDREDGGASSGYDRAAGKGGGGPSIGGWRRGDRVYHDDYGYGAVADVRDSEDGPVVLVRFETGKELRFLSEHQASRFTRIGKED
jgi:DNA helicase-2/ATP-dependent DNA helicase PcrA